MNIYGIAFKANGKVYYFNGHNLNIVKGTNVIVETEKGLQYGKAILKIEDKNFSDLKDIIRIADENDENVYLDNLKDAEKALNNAKKIAQELDLEMRILDASYTFDRRQLLFNFVSDGRIDFRELAKRLAGIYRTRIELRQIGARDKAKELGGLGQCGRTLCCSSFLGHIDSVTINMAKNQNIALNPNKINGSCGRLLCCLEYEDDNYTCCQKGMPYVGQRMKYNGEEGTVVGIDILNRSYKIQLNSERKEVQLDKECSCKEGKNESNSWSRESR